jgi:hypothetical protein
MNIKKSIAFISKLYFFPVFFLFLISCHSFEEKTDTAFEEAKVSKEFTDDSLDMETEADLVPLLKTKPIKVVVIDPWTNYAKEIEKEIRTNEKSIADLRAASGSNAKEFKKIASLEKSNQELQSNLIEYKQIFESNMEKFKSQMRLDLTELEQDLKELSEGIKAD